MSETAEATNLWTPQPEVVDAQAIVLCLRPRCGNGIVESVTLVHHLESKVSAVQDIAIHAQVPATNGSNLAATMLYVVSQIQISRYVLADELKLNVPEIPRGLLDPRIEHITR